VVAGERLLDESRRSLLIERATLDRREDDHSFAADRARGLAVQPERDTLDARELGCGIDDLGDAHQHRDAAAADLEATTEVNRQYAPRQGQAADDRPRRDSACVPLLALERGRAAQQSSERGPCRR
jgi:hypothetical protein